MGIYNNDNWTLARGEVDGHPFIIRARSSLPSQADREYFSHLIVISWGYERDANDGFPPPAVSEHMENFETALFESFNENSAEGCGVAVVTTDGTRQWRFYTPDTEAFMEAFNQALAGQPAYPIELEAFTDPEWGALAELINPEADTGSAQQ